jgi:hypothetical protein
LDRVAVVVRSEALEAAAAANGVAEEVEPRLQVESAGEASRIQVLSGKVALLALRPDLVGAAITAVEPAVEIPLVVPPAVVVVAPATQHLQ